MGKYRAITLMTAVQITQPLLKSPACKQSQNPHMDSRRPAEGRRVGEGEPKDSRGSASAGKEGGPPPKPSPALSYSDQALPMEVLPSVCHFFFLAPSLPLSLAATPSPRDTEQGLAGEGDSCGLLLSWPGKPPPFWKSKYFLGLRSSLGLSPFFGLSSFLRELSVPLHPGHGHY